MVFEGAHAMTDDQHAQVSSSTPFVQKRVALQNLLNYLPIGEIQQVSRI